MKRMITQELIDYLASLSESQLNDILEKVSFDEYGVLHIDASVVVNELSIEEDGGLLYVYLSQFVNPDNGNPLFPLENNAGKVLAVNEDEEGLVAVAKGYDIDNINFGNDDFGSGKLPQTNQSSLTTEQEEDFYNKMIALCEKGYCIHFNSLLPVSVINKWPTDIQICFGGVQPNYNDFTGTHAVFIRLDTANHEYKFEYSEI